MSEGGFKPGEVVVFASGRRSGKSLLAAGQRLAAALSNLTISDRQWIMEALREGDQAGLNGNTQAQVEATQKLVTRCAAAIANVPPGVRERVFSEPSLPEGVQLVDQDQLEKLRGIEKRLHGGSDKMRDEGHRLWLVLNEIEGK